jgi:Ice-binding-like/Secretion system C-terminal sorting domain
MKPYLPYLILSFSTAITLLSFRNASFGQVPDLGTAANFILFSTTGAVGNTGISQISGNVGANSGDITGFEDLNVVLYNADAVTAQCSADLQVAYDQLNGRIPAFFPASLLGSGQVLNAGVYSISEAATLDLDLTFDAQGDPNAIFVIQVQGAFSTTANSSIHLINGAMPFNVFWKVEGAVSMATGTIFRGIIIANNGAISLGSGCTFEGKALSTTGAVSVYGLIAYGPGVIPLPLSLIEFKAARINGAVNLLWTTTNELALSRYELERSADGIKFYTIGSMRATNTHLVKTYNWQDNEPLAGMNLYRLKMLEIDQAFKYSIVLKMDMNTQKDISLYPNPVTGHIVQLHFLGQLKGDHIVNVYNNNGENIMRSKITLDKNDDIKSIELNKSLTGGTYYLKISDPEMNNKTLKILIN